MILTRHSRLPVCTVCMVCTMQDGGLGYLPVGNALSDSIPLKSFIQNDMPHIKQKIVEIHQKKLVPVHVASSMRYICCIGPWML